MSVIRRTILALLLMSLAGCDNPPNPHLNPFTTDACSGFPNGTWEHRTLWLHCCTEHDIAYWQGGTRDERRAADFALRECVREAGEPTIANVMLIGVWIGGTPLLPTSFRWGYGWPYLRGYEPLDRAARETARNALQEFRRNE